MNRWVEKVIDENTPGAKFIGDYRVTARFFESGAVMIDKVERFNEMFQVYSDLTLLILTQTEELESLRSKLADWYIGEQLSELEHKRLAKLEFNNDDLPPAA